jgi:HAD superfamily phosphatase (TIGR01668 family)
MFKSLLPTWYSEKLTKINLEYLKSSGVKVLFFDLDNTLGNYQETKPDNSIIQFFYTLKKANFSVFIISNNHNEKRVKTYSEALTCDGYLYRAGKPKIKKINLFIKEQKIKLKEMCIVGDQLLTDVLLANRLKTRSILVEPKSKKDLPITRINRIIDKQIRTYFKKKHQLIDIGQDIK